MIEPEAELASALVNTALLALWPVLPGLIALYVRQCLAVGRARPEFSLRKSEAAELDRALALYEGVARRLRAIDDEIRDTNASWCDYFIRRAELRRRHAEELDDLEAHAAHLRASILRLKRRPLRRLKSFVHGLSARFAFGRALAAYVGGVVLMAGLPLFGQSAFGDEAVRRVNDLLIWYPADPRLFYANAVAAVFAAVAAPFSYIVQRARLRRAYAVEFSMFGDFATVDFGRLADEPQPEPADLGPPHEAPPLAFDAGPDCFAVLGLADTATADEIKEAYKTLIKQNHPDRVAGMSRVFRELAEAETKKLNIAYEQALLAVAPFVETDCVAPS